METEREGEGEREAHSPIVECRCAASMLRAARTNREKPSSRGAGSFSLLIMCSARQRS